MLETVLMRTFLLQYASDYEGDDDRLPYKSGKSRGAERRAYTTLASVCWNWRQTLRGWPESPTSQWLQHQLKQRIERKYTWKLLPCLQSSLIGGLTALWTVLLLFSVLCIPSSVSFLILIVSMLWCTTTTLLVFLYDVVQHDFFAHFIIMCPKYEPVCGSDIRSRRRLSDWACVS